MHFYNDDGSEVNPNLISKPSLCLSCKFDDDPRQEVLCTLNRMDQIEKDEFACGAYDESLLAEKSWE